MDEETVEPSPNPTETTELTSQDTKPKSSDGGSTDATTKQEEEKGDNKSNIDSNLSDIASQSSVKSGDSGYDNYSETQWQKIRKTVRLEIVQTSWFETVILIVILINCVFLALDNPTKEDQTLKDVVYITEVVFTVIYIIEMCLKFIGLGFVGRHTVYDTAKDKNVDQKASVFSYMVNTVFNGEEEAEKKDEYVGYFLDGWNVLDFFVVVIGSIVPLLLPNAASVGSIRALRTLRALRTIPRVPKLRTLVMTIIDAIPGLTGSFILLSFFFIVFGIIGIQLFHGQLKQQCTTMVDGVQVPLTYISIDTEYTALCSVDEDNPGGKVFFGYKVPPQTCNDVAIALGLPPVYECTDGNENPVAGMQNYDNIFYSLLQIFQTVTLQDWSMQLYNLSRSRSYVISAFFVPLTFLVSFFAINLILAVIVDTYSRSNVVVQIEEDYDSTLHEMDELIAQKTSKRSAPVKQQITYQTYPRKLRALREKVKTFEELFKEYNQGPVERANKTHELQRKTKLRVDTARGGKDDSGNDAKSIHLELRAIAEEVQNESKEEIYDKEEMKEETWEFTQRADEQKKLRREMIEDMMLNFNKDLAFEVWLLAKPIKDDWLSGKPADHGHVLKAATQSTGVGGSVETEQEDRRRCWEKRKPMFIRWLHWVSTSEWFEKAIIFIILLNTIILAIHWPQMNEELEQGLTVLNYCFTILFALELLIKVIGLGPERWWFDKFNVFDAVIVLVSLVELGIPDAGAGALLAFRALRVLRVLRLLHQIPGLRVLFSSILNSFEPVVFLTMIILLFVFMFGVLGVQLFAGKVYPDLRVDETGELDGFLLMTRPWRFDDLWYSMVTFLQLFTGNGWPSVMEDTVLATTESSALVVIVAVVIGLWLFRNMFLAILINRLGSQDNIQLMIDDLLILAREKQRIFDEKTAIKEFEKDVRQIRKQRMGSQSASKHQQRIEAIEASKKITGKSLMCVAPTNRVRIMLHRLQSSDSFEWCINVLILLNCIFLALNGPHVPMDSEEGHMLRVLDFVFTSIFFLEMAIKMVALGIYKSRDKNKSEEEEEKERARKVKKHLHHDDYNYNEDEDIDYAEMPCTNAYLQSGWNIIDGLVVLFAIIGLIVPEVGFVRGLRAIRPIRIAIRIPQVRVVVKALLASINQVFIAVLFSFFIIFVLGIVGLQLFSGQFGRCVHPGNAFDVVMDLSPPNADQCIAEGYDFLNPGYNFDNIFASLLTVFKISMFSNWYDELSAGMASGGNSKQDPSAFAATPYNRPISALFFVGIVLVAGFFVLNIIISVVVDSFNRIKNEDEANALLTQQQVLWVRKRRFLNRFPLRQGHKPPKGRHKWRLPFFNFVEKTLFEYFIIFCILANTVILMTEHEGQPQEWTDALFWFEIVFITIFTIEAILKLLGYGIKGYFSEPWNVFDFVIVVVSFVGLALSDSGLAVIRLLRVLRVIRLVKKAPLLRALFVTLGYALPSLINIGLLLLVIFFIFGIFGVELFGKVIHSDGYGNASLYDSNEGLSQSINFEYFGGSLFILYRTATNDNWGSILLAAGAQGANDCPDSMIAGQSAADGTFDYQCGSMPWSVLYFILFTIFGTFVLINLFIAVILDTYVDNVEFETKLVKLQLLNDWKERWLAKEREQYGKKLKPRLPIKMFVNTLKASPVLIGFLLEALNLRLNIEDTDAEIDYDDIQELKKRSTETYGKLDFVGKPNPADKQVVVTNDHLNAVFKTRRLRILCSYRGSELNEKLVVTYSDALFALCSLLVGPEFRLLPYDNNRQVHISDWWAERLEEMMMNSGTEYVLQNK